MRFSRGDPAQRVKKETAVEEALTRLRKAVQEGKVIAVDGSEMEFTVDTVLVHGDNLAIPRDRCGKE